MTLSVLDMSGHTELSFTEGQVRLRWKDAPPKERKKAREMVERAEDWDFKVHDVDQDGHAADELDEKQIAKAFKKKNGEMILKGTVDSVRVVAKDLVEAEIKEGMLVMELQKDGSWKALEAGSYKPKEKEKQKVTSAPRPRGG